MFRDVIIKHHETSLPRAADQEPGQQIWVLPHRATWRAWATIVWILPLTKYCQRGIFRLYKPSQIYKLSLREGAKEASKYGISSTIPLSNFISSGLILDLQNVFQCWLKVVLLCWLLLPKVAIRWNGLNESNALLQWYHNGTKCKICFAIHLSHFWGGEGGL